MNFGAGNENARWVVPRGANDSNRKRSVYNSGNIKMEQNGSKLSLTVSNYKFDGIFPQYNNEYNSQSGIVYKDNVGCFSVGYFQIIIPDNDACAQYAYFELGDTLKAKDFMLKVIENNPDNPGSYYDAACLYTRIGEVSKAIEYLEESLKKGYKRFKHIENDDDLKQIINTKEYQKLIEKYKIESDEKSGDISYNFNIKTFDIPYKKDGDLYIVNCKVNNLPLHFIFDTGASDISISDVEANFMYKNNYLNNNDFIGKKNYLTADGSISEGTIINIRNVNIGGLELKNVRASVVKNQRAPLLLGQSVLNRLGKIEIDNEKKIIKVTCSMIDF